MTAFNKKFLQGERISDSVISKSVNQVGGGEAQ
jgi:hypothetical protein